jgi:hypothetical protein
MTMKVGDRVIFVRTDGTTVNLPVHRVRAANRVDVRDGGTLVEMIPLGVGPMTYSPIVAQMMLSSEAADTLVAVPRLPARWPHWVAIGLSAAAAALSLYNMLGR